VVEQGALPRALGPHDGHHGVPHARALHAAGAHKVDDARLVKLALGVHDLEDARHGGQGVFLLFFSGLAERWRGELAGGRIYRGRDLAGRKSTRG
jgi:hypothetical protein